MRALAPKHKGGEWEEAQAAANAELEAERALAAARGEPYAMPLDSPPLWDVGAPLPHLLQSDYKAFLVYYAREPDPNWDGSYVNVRQPSDATESKLVVVEFQQCIWARLGSPNDEVLSGHPLYGKGLEGYRPMRVENSTWIEDLRKISSVHRQYSPDRWSTCTHYIFGFHDSMFECVAQSLVAEVRESSMSEMLSDVCKRLVSEI